MWNAIVNMILTACNAVWSWTEQLFDAIPGSWSTVFTVILICIISRFLLGPLLGTAFVGGSDKASDIISDGISDRAEKQKEFVKDNADQWDSGIENR